MDIRLFISVKILLGILVVSGFISCSEKENEDAKSLDRIKFNTTVSDYETRASSTYGVLDMPALRNSADGFMVSTSGLPGTNMSNVVVKYASATSTWNYTGSYYWSINPSANAVFTAYAPAGFTGATLTTSSFTVSSYNPPTTIANHTDILYAPPTSFNRGTSGSSGVVLPFKHLLTQIVFTVVTDIPATSNPTVSLTLAMPKPTGTYNGTTWSVSGTTARNYTILTNAPIGSTMITSPPLLLIPRTLVAGVNLTVKVGYKTSSKSKVVDLYTLPTKTWVGGTKITYNITIPKTSVPGSYPIQRMEVNSVESEWE